MDQCREAHGFLHELHRILYNVCTLNVSLLGSPMLARKPTLRDLAPYA